MNVPHFIFQRKPIGNLSSLSLFDCSSQMIKTMCIIKCAFYFSFQFYKIFYFASSCGNLQGGKYLPDFMSLNFPLIVLSSNKARWRNEVKRVFPCSCRYSFEREQDLKHHRPTVCLGLDVRLVLKATITISIP